jgi:hypothetical protein
MWRELSDGQRKPSRLVSYSPPSIVLMNIVNLVCRGIRILRLATIRRDPTPKTAFRDRDSEDNTMSALYRPFVDFGSI